jgi:hypothetical protein
MGRCAEIDLVPQTVDLDLYAGDGAKLRLVVETVTGEVVPIDGAVTAQIRSAPDDPGISVTWVTDLSEGAEGVIGLSLTGLQTASLINGKDFSGVWDVEWDSLLSEPVTLMRGKCTCTLDVTRQ